MGKDDQKQKLKGPWRTLHGAVWMIGLAILAWQNWWWPGILVLTAISLIIEALLQFYAPQAFEPVKKPEAPPPATTPAVETTPSNVPPAEHRAELLPLVCPKCGGPIRGREVRWTGAQSADCPFCGANLPMKM